MSGNSASVTSRCWCPLIVFFHSGWDLPGSCMLSGFDWDLDLVVLCSVTAHLNLGLVGPFWYYSGGWSRGEVSPFYCHEGFLVTAGREQGCRLPTRPLMTQSGQSEAPTDTVGRVGLLSAVQWQKSLFCTRPSVMSLFRRGRCTLSGKVHPSNLISPGTADYRRACYSRVNGSPNSSFAFSDSIPWEAGALSWPVRGRNLGSPLCQMWVWRWCHSFSMVFFLNIAVIVWKFCVSGCSFPGPLAGGSSVFLNFFCPVHMAFSGCRLL